MSRREFRQTPGLKLIISYRQEKSAKFRKDANAWVSVVTRQKLH
jgi:hypothetical protein